MLIEQGRTNGMAARAARIVATVCVLGLVGVLWLQSRGGEALDSAVATPLTALDATSDDSTTVPSAASVFGNAPAPRIDELPPTF